MTPIVVAIDGPAGAGKSTVARAVAARCGLILVDTGAIYRSVALAAKERAVSWDDEEALAVVATGLVLRFHTTTHDNRILLDERDVSEAIRARDVALGASKVSRYPKVREALLDVQRAFGREGPGAVLEGRDIGTVVFPDAAVKIFLTASPEERARRRALELEQQGQAAPFDVILDEIKSRDRADMERAVAPLVEAADATRVDSTERTETEVISAIVAMVERVREAA